MPVGYITIEVRLKSRFGLACLGLCLTQAWAAHAAPQLPAGTQEGDLIFRKGTEAVSAAVLAVDQGGFSHVGMLVGVPGRWQVLHAVPSEVEGRADGVVLDSLAFFLDPARSQKHVVYRVIANARERGAAVQAAQKMLGKPFRIARDDEAEGTYCTELIYKAWKEAGVDFSVRFRTLSFPLFTPKPYLVPSELMASPRLQMLPAASSKKN